MARGGPPPLFMGAPLAKALCLLLLTSARGLLATAAHVARATTADHTSLCGEGSGMPCPERVEPASTAAVRGPGGAGNPGRGLVGIPSAAPTPSPMAFVNSTAVAECEEESLVCLADDECQSCYEIASGLSSSEEFEACREAYMEGVSPTDALVSVAVSSTCDVVGAMYCCSNEISENDCLAGDKTSLYWGCVFESYGCELEEVACLDVGESYRSDDDDVGGRASNPMSGAGKAVTPWSSGVGCVAVAAVGLAAAAATSMAM